MAEKLNKTVRSGLSQKSNAGGARVFQKHKNPLLENR